MTNGEKIIEIFPNATTRIYKHKDFTCIVVEQDDKWIADFDVDWWNSEYKEPITENCIACKYDETEEEDGEHCKKCLSGNSQFELDNEFVEPTTKNDLVPRNVVERIIKSPRTKEQMLSVLNSLPPQEPCGDDVVSRDVVKEQMIMYGFHAPDMTVTEFVEDLPPVNPKETTTKNDLGVDSTPNTISFKEMTDNLKITAEDIENAEDLEYSIEPLIRPKNNLGVDCISREDALMCLTGKFENREYEPSELIKMFARRIKALPSVIPQEPRVDFEELKRRIFMEVDGGTDDAWLAYGEVCDRISNAIDEFVSDMRGEEV